MTVEFSLKQVGDRVLDRTKSKVGTIQEINYKDNTAKIKVEGNGNEFMISKLHNLTRITEDKKTKVEELNNMDIKVKYFNKDLTKLKKISKGDWVDLRASETIHMKAGEFKLIPLGVAMKLPDGYEAHVAPRSSTFKNFGVIQTNSLGIVDNSYSGNDDQWFFPAYALRDTTIGFDERICQFRIQKCMPSIEFTEVDEMEGENRGGHGSTGTK